MPDPVMGERACCFAVLKPDAALTLDDIRAWLTQHEIGKTKWPERLEIVSRNAADADAQDQEGGFGEDGWQPNNSLVMAGHDRHPQFAIISTRRAAPRVTRSSTAMTR